MVIPKGLFPLLTLFLSLSLSFFLFLLAVQHADEWINYWLIEREWLSFAIIFNMLS